MSQKQNKRFRQMIFGQGARWVAGLALLVVLGLGIAALAAAPVDPKMYAGLAWRNIGPFRAGRVSAVSGAIGQPGVFYFGAPLGGVWKTTSAGITWYPVMDSVTEASSVGAVQVAPSVEYCHVPFVLSAV